MTNARMRARRLCRIAIIPVILISSGPLRAANVNRDAPKTITITGDRLSGSVLPVEPLPGPILLESQRAWTWTVDDTKRLVLEGDVHIQVAAHEFKADRAAVWLNRMASADGVINQIAIYFDTLRNSAGRAGVGVAGKSMLVTGSTRGDVTLMTVINEPKRAKRTEFLRGAEARLAQHLRQIAGDPPPPLASRPQVEAPLSMKDAFEPEPGRVYSPEDLDPPRTIALPPAIDEHPWLRAPNSVVSFAADLIEFEPSEIENTITATGSVTIEYFILGEDREDDLNHLVLAADRAVVFTDPGSIEEMAGWQTDAERVRGVYLEGNVVATANHGEHLVRAPKAYYDFATGRAIMIDAVLRTYDREGKIPIYARAEELRQVAADEWTGAGMRVTTSEFHVGHLALGAEKMVVTRRAPNEDEPGDTRTIFDARDITVRAGGVPVFYWPRFKGTVQDIPLRSVEIGTRDNDGVSVETAWNLYTLLGVEPVDGVDAELKIDAYSKRGAGIGLELDYDVADGAGVLDLYGLYDNGVDRTSTGREIEQDEELRGIALLEHQQKLSPNWLMQAQLSYISDETFITSWREDDFRERREYETSLYLKHQKDRAALTLLGKFDPNEFISNDYLLASQQYQVDKLPELTYRRYGDKLFDDAITYSSETRLSRMRFAFERSTPGELGVRGRAFGISDEDQISDELRARGLDSQYVMRADTRHEFSRPTKWGIFNLTPFVVARGTIYDDDFDGFSSDSDSSRLYGAGGLRVSTQFQHIDNSVENRVLDLHRLRHIIEPNMTIWYAWSDVSQDDLPLYDPDVESLATGAAVRLGLRNTWQTQRGGPGRWRSVDVFTLDTNVVFNSGEGDRESPIPQFFDYRPEYSQFGDHFDGSALWLLSDAMSIGGTVIYDLDESAVARGSIGAEIRHTPTFSTYVEFRYIDIVDSELLGVGWNYQITPKYRVQLQPQWDFREDEFRSLRLEVARRFPEFEFRVQVRHDEIKDDTSIGASVGLVEY